MADLVKFHCLACGAPFKSELELRAHMAERHVAGRDYFVCEECGRVVMNLDLHMSAKHGAPPVPPDKQRRCEKRDWDLTRRRNRKHRGPKFKSGLYYSEKMRRNLLYRSGWEASVYKILDRSPDVRAYIPEPFPIGYRYGTEDRNYWPDILIEMTDGSRLLVEVKPKGQTKQPVNRAKWEAAAAHCEAHGIVFRVWTEVAIGKLGETPASGLTARLLMS